MNVVTLNTFVVFPAHVPSIFPPPRLAPSFQNICKCWPLFYHLVKFLSRKHLHFQALSSRISETIQPRIEPPRRGNAQQMPLPQARSPKKDDGSFRCTPVERLKRRSRRRHRSSYDHSRQICRSIVEVVKLDSDESKEIVQRRNCKSVKVGRTKVFLQEAAVIRTKCL